VPVYIYRAIGLDGRSQEGEAEARSKAELLRQLDEQNLQPLSVRAREDHAPSAAAVSGASGPLLLSRRQIIDFTDEISELLDAGLALEPSLKTMEHRQELGHLKILARRLRERIVEGTPFSAALKAASPSFGELYCNLAAAGEASGALSSILRRQARYLQAMDDLQNRVVMALIYPVVIFFAVIALLVFFMVYLVPQLTKLLKTTGQTLPWATRLLVGLSEWTMAYGWMVAVAAVLAALGFWSVIRTPQGRRWWDEFVLKIPVFGPVVEMRFYAQLSQTLANLVANGIPLLNALRLARAATLNVYFHELLGSILDVVADGGSFTKALKRAGCFPPLFMDMVSVGEHTGDLGTALEKVAARYDKELGKRIQVMTTLIMPVSIVLIGGVVLLVSFSIISGIFQTISGLKMR
jgi:type II secretory pathway component PulF